MNRTINSDSEFSPTMIANKIFNDILKQIQDSGLNFQLQVSPFGAMISLKKSLVKDEKGNIINPSSSLISGILYNKENMADLPTKNVVLQNDRDSTDDVPKAVDVDVKIKNAVKIDLETEDLEKVTDTVVLNKIKQNPAVKDKDRAKDKKIYKVEENLMNEVNPEFETIEMDLNYNVKVSNPFSPLLEVDQEKPPPPSNYLQPPPSRRSPVTWNSTKSRSPSPKPSRTPPSTNTPSESESTQSDEEDQVYFEGNLISKQEAFKKIIEAVQDMGKNFFHDKTGILPLSIL